MLLIVYILSKTLSARLPNTALVWVMAMTGFGYSILEKYGAEKAFWRFFTDV